MITFGSRLKSLRQKKGLTQRELAKLIGAKHNSIRVDFLPAAWGILSPVPLDFQKKGFLPNVRTEDKEKSS